MATQIPFLPTGKTYVITGNGVSSFILINSDSPANQLDIFNSGPATAYIRIGGNSANVTAGVPSVGNPTYGWPLANNTGITRTCSQAGTFSNLTISVATTAANTVATVYVTAGEGF